MATEFDPLRYGAWATPSYTRSKIIETYSHNNSISYPHENRPAGRAAVEHPPHRRALLEALTARGALLSFSNSGVEAPVAFLPPDAHAALAAAGPASQRTFYNHVWAPYAYAAPRTAYRTPRPLSRARAHDHRRLRALSERRQRVRPSRVCVCVAAGRRRRRCY